MKGIKFSIFFFVSKQLPEDFSRVDQTVDHYVPVDIDSVIHKLRIELV